MTELSLLSRLQHSLSELESSEQPERDGLVVEPNRPEDSDSFIFLFWVFLLCEPENEDVDFPSRELLSMDDRSVFLAFNFCFGRGLLILVWEEAEVFLFREEREVVQGIMMEWVDGGLDEAPACIQPAPR